MTTFDRETALKIFTQILRILDITAEQLDTYLEEIASRQEDEGMRQRLLHTLKELLHVERMELSREEAAQEDTLAAEQRAQIIDLRLLEQAVERLHIRPDLGQSAEQKIDKLFQELEKEIALMQEK